MKNIRCICCAIVVFVSPVLAQDGDTVILKTVLEVKTQTSSELTFQVVTMVFQMKH